MTPASRIRRVADVARSGERREGGRRRRDAAAHRVHAAVRAGRAARSTRRCGSRSSTSSASIAGAMTTIVDWIIAVAPIGVFALVVAAASRVGVALAGAMAYYILAISAVLVLFALLIYPVAAIAGRNSAADVRARRAAGAGRRAELELVARVAAGAGRGLASGSRSRSRSPGSCFRFRCRSSRRRRRSLGSWAPRFSRGSTACALSTGTIVSIAFTAVALSLTIPGVPQGAQLLLAPVLVDVRHSGRGRRAAHRARTRFPICSGR